MKNIKANVKELLEILNKNRNLHHDIFVAAQKVYRSEVIRKLDQHLQAAKDGKEFPGSIHIPAPEDHTKDYDRVIRMLQLSVEENIELDERDVEVYVLDRWNWSHSWASSNLQYLNTETLFATGSVSSSFSSTGFSETDIATWQTKLGSYL